ncbi:transferase hexapeptide repeat containing protein [sediment metagenome]|uniref:Transferase hexapeptide repeat containing protein n=1 Tax=sediment metagenome TaxID=749907 RepID=D9PHX5_9ZZZZ
MIPPNVYIAFGVRLANCRIGDYTRIRHFTTAYYTTIGKFSSIGKNSRLGIGQHPTNMISTNLVFYKNNPISNKWVKPIAYEEYKPIHIGNDVWVGEASMIMGGVNVGDGAIIAARSVVTKDVPPYAIVAGVPAKIVKYRFDEETIKYLMDLKWWNLPDENIEKKLEAFTIQNITKTRLKEFFE